MSNTSRRVVIGNAVLLATLLVFAHALLKWVAQHPAETYTSLLITYWPVIFFSIAVYCFVFFYYAYLLKKIEITQLYPAYTGLSIIFLLMVGVVIFHENITWSQIIGCLLIIGGLFLISE